MMAGKNSRRGLRAALFAGLSGLLCACTPFAVINWMTPDAGYQVHQGIAYGSDPRQKFDIYVPDGLHAPAPVILFLYGGSWQSGRRQDYKAFGQAMTSKGIIAVVADYRLYPQVTYPVFVQDGAAAFHHLRGIIASYGGDPDRITLAGHSAGGYIAVMLGSDPQFLKQAGDDIAHVAGVIGIAGPYDFLPLRDPKLVAIFHGPDDPQILPINHVDGMRPPMLLLTGSADDTVEPGNAARMAARLRHFGSPVKEIVYPGIGHIGIILSLAPGFRGRIPLQDDIASFVRDPR
jgi:acetyl esterase/lipase